MQTNKLHSQHGCRKMARHDLWSRNISLRRCKTSEKQLMLTYKRTKFNRKTKWINMMNILCSVQLHIFMPSI